MEYLRLYISNAFLPASYMSLFIALFRYYGRYTFLFSDLDSYEGIDGI